MAKEVKDKKSSTLSNNNNLFENLNNIVKESGKSKIVIIGDYSLKMFISLTRNNNEILKKNKINDVYIYDPKGKIEFKYLKSINEMKQKVVEDFWNGIGLGGLDKKERIEKIKEADNDEELADEMLEAGENAIEALRVENNEFNDKYYTNKLFSKWIDGLVKKDEDSETISISQNLSRNYKSDYDFKTIKEFNDFNDYLIICVSNKIIVDDLFVDILNEIYTYNHKIVFIESTKDRLCINHMLRLTRNSEKIVIRKNNKYEDYLIKVNF